MSVKMTDLNTAKIFAFSIHLNRSETLDFTFRFFAPLSVLCVRTRGADYRLAMKIKFGTLH